MKTSPLLLGAALLFWGWQTGHLVAGAALATVLEGARLTKARWEFTDEDFRRIWTFCALLLLAAALYAFTASEGPSGVRGFLQNPSLATERNASNASARTVAALIRWLPMIFFLFVAAQAFSSRQGVPPETISVILRRRWQKARKLGRPLPGERSVNISYPYFILCLFAASFRTREDETFYWGLCALLAGALWSQRSRRYGIAIWAGAVAVAVVLGYSGQREVGRLYRLFDNYNAQWFSRAAGGADPLQSKTALGQIGRLKGSSKIVIRLEPKDGGRAPPLLREASYRAWKGQAWYSELTRDKYEGVYHEGTNHTTWVLLPGNANSAAVNLACYLPGGSALLPLPTGSARLENLSAFMLYKSGLGAVLADGPGLVVFDALYGPGPTMDSPANTNEDLSVPPKESPALDQVIAKLQLKTQDRKQALRTLSAFFQDQFRYSSWQGLGRLWSTNETPLSRFLLRTRSGHCEYFATATVLLLRQLGIPARYAVGYAVHESTGRKYVVRQRDAHAWCLVWNPNTATWQDFDTTPASWVQAEANRAAPMQFLSDGWSRLVFEFAKFRWGQTHLRQYILWALVPVLVLLLCQIIFRSRRRRHTRSQAAPGAAVLWPGLDSEFYQVERRLVERGAPRQPSEPLSAWLLRAIADPALAELRGRLRELLRLHYRYRFDPQGLTRADREALRREASGCLASMK